MEKSGVIIFCLVFVCFLFCHVEGYPIGDLTLEGLLEGSQVRTALRRRRAAVTAQTNGCKYPGTVAVTVAGRVLYTGLYQKGTIRLPTDALEIIKLSNKFNVLTIYGDDGTAKATIAQNALQAATQANTDGTSTIKLSTDFSSTNCASNDAILYDSATMNVDVTTCKTASYGGNGRTIHTYDKTLQIDPLGKSALKGCCADVMPNILGKAPNFGHPSKDAVSNSFTCLKSAEGICNGDIGSPIYCTDTRSGQEVVVGMVDSGTCKKGEYFGAIDLTQGTLTGFSR
ncbi:hypothetical protein ACOMHN_041799 [Nucella lapillus]